MAGDGRSLWSTAPKGYFSSNNFDLVRLFAATQVLVGHAIEHLRVGIPLSWHLYSYFQGVPTFFFISGFLISASWERYTQIRTYGINRILRIYPALWLVFAISLLSFLILGNTSIVMKSPALLLVWAATQLTFLQVYNPEFVRGYGTGVMNGSLWTIPVELGFYAATPMIYALGKRFGRIDLLVAIIAAGSFLVLYSLHLWNYDHASMVTRIVAVTPTPWIGMFCIGILCQRHIDKIYPFVAGRFWIFLIAYVAIVVIGPRLGPPALFASQLNSLGIVVYLALCLLVLSFAYSWRGLADRLLRRNDISYGIYIFHMPIINALLVLHLTGAFGLLAAITATVCMATLSWLLVERRALQLRSHPLFRRTT